MELQFIFFLISKIDVPSSLLFPRLLQEISRRNREEQEKIPIHIFISENAIYSLIDPPKYLIECWIESNCHLYINQSHWNALLSAYGNTISHSMPPTSRFLDGHRFNTYYCQLLSNLGVCVVRL